ncbi:MAG: peptidoglycan editing factor PgeF [Syntrophomonadaceae bacterium]|jgi:YfiH family protein
MQDWQWQKKQGISYITVPEWYEQGAFAAFSARLGGVSNIPCDSLNMGLHVGDKPHHVLENRKRFMLAAGGQLDQMVCCQQVHGDSIKLINQRHAGFGARKLETAIGYTDAMVTDVPGVFLTTFYADCFPVYFFDPIKKVVALAHSGWKGTMLRIAEKTMLTMISEYKSQTEDICCFIGPGIGACCFAIADDLADRAGHEFAALNDIIRYNNATCYWDLSATIQQCLLMAGIKKDQITICPLCTCCNPDHFYSFRRDQGNTGRMGAVITLLERD